MAKVLIGNFKGPKGNDGQKGNKGEKGETGQRGSRWSEGTAITGTSTTATIFSGSGITDALVNDVYLNTSTGNVYRCTVAGAAAAAKWVYVGCIKGAKGNDGKTPTVVDDMTVAFTQASSRANIATGEKMSTIMGKIKKFFADLTAPAFAQMITTKDDLLATKVTGYVPDAKAVADAVTDVNSKLQAHDLTLTITNNSDRLSYSTGACYRFGNIVFGNMSLIFTQADNINVDVGKFTLIDNGVALAHGVARSAAVSYGNDNTCMITLQSTGDISVAGGGLTTNKEYVFNFILLLL